MSKVSKQELLQEIEGLLPGCYEQVLHFVQFVKHKYGHLSAEPLAQASDANSAHASAEPEGASSETDAFDPY